MTDDRARPLVGPDPVESCRPGCPCLTIRDGWTPPRVEELPITSPRSRAVDPLRRSSTRCCAPARGGYEFVTGHRTVAAARLAGLDRVGRRSCGRARRLGRPSLRWRSTARRTGRLTPASADEAPTAMRPPVSATIRRLRAWSRGRLQPSATPLRRVDAVPVDGVARVDARCRGRSPPRERLSPSDRLVRPPCALGPLLLVRAAPGAAEQRLRRHAEDARAAGADGVHRHSRSGRHPTDGRDAITFL